MTAADPPRPPAVVVGGDLNALGVVRSLAAHRVPTIVVAADPAEIVMHSRFASKLLVRAIEGPGFVDDLLTLARRHAARPVLFLTEEKTVRTVSEHRAALGAAYHLRLPDHDRLMALMHKQGFQELAEAAGAPVPRTVYLRGASDVARLAGLAFPCVLKPAWKNYDYGRRFKKAYVVDSADEAAARYAEIEGVLAEMVVQEWIDGGDDDIYFVLQYVGADGTPIASFTGRKLRSWPPRIGGTASCTVAGPEAAGLDAVTADFFARVGFAGMGSMEFKRDRRDGRFYMVEPTVARTDFQEEVATLNGVNVPFAAYRYELGLAIPAPQASDVPCIWREPVTDRWARTATHAGRPAMRAAVVDAYWRLDDPMPWLCLVRDRVRDRLRALRAR